jgi:Global regulator protein family
MLVRTDSKEERTALSITRKVGERIVLGDDIVLHVLEVVGGSVRLGIDAPRSIPSTARRSGRPCGGSVMPHPFRRRAGCRRGPRADCFLPRPTGTVQSERPLSEHQTASRSRR